MLNGVGDERIHRRHCFYMAGRRLWEFAPHSRESLILPSRGANFLPGRGAGGCESLRLTPGKALFLRREAQTLRRGIRPEPVRVCAPVPGKPYFSVDGRKPFTRKSSRWLCEFAPHSRESLISPSRGANLSPANRPPGNPPGAFPEGLRRKPRRRKRRTAGCIRR